MAVSEWVGCVLHPTPKDRGTEKSPQYASQHFVAQQDSPKVVMKDKLEPHSTYAEPVQVNESAL
jgi:hypothetical protein